MWLLLSSYFFYGFANINIVPLLLGVTVVFYVLGKYLYKLIQAEKWDAASHMTTFGVCLGVGLLLYFKYLNFFGESFAALFEAVGFNVTWTTLNIVLPIGVSFFTFKLISYIIEINRESIEASDNFVEFALYISFFPTILSGPIDRPNHFLPQLRREHNFNYPLAVDGCRQILWGMFTKMCVADNLAGVTSGIWSTYTTANGLELILIALLYTVEMYADFSGYSNMAIGVGKILGFNITQNFNHPLLARNVAEYWRRWHISLTKWITDYVFMPLNFSFRNLGKAGAVLAILINLIVIGFWHGANWIYGVYGLYHGLLFVPLMISGAFANSTDLAPNRFGLPQLGDFLKMCLTFCIITFGLLIFSSPDFTTLIDFVGCMFSNFEFSKPHLGVSIYTYVFMAMIFILEWISRNDEYNFPFAIKCLSKSCFKWMVYIVLAVFIIFYSGNQTEFIYFQF